MAQIVLHPRCKVRFNSGEPMTFMQFIARNAHAVRMHEVHAIIDALATRGLYEGGTEEAPWAVEVAT